MKKNEIVEIVKDLIAAESCCDELKDIGSAYLDAVGTDKEQVAAEMLVERAEMDITTIDDLITLTNSQEGAQIFGAMAPFVLDTAVKEKDAGREYCFCEACMAAEKIINNKDVILPQGAAADGTKYFSTEQEQEEAIEFRKMRRFKQQTSEEECIKILKEGRRGVLAVAGENGYPYALPMNYWYDQQTGKIFFHGAKDGHKNDALKACQKVCFTVSDEGFKKEGEWYSNVTSVIIFGTIRFVDSEAEQDTYVRILTEMVYKYYPKAAADERMVKHWPKAQMLELTIDHMTGKLVAEK